MGRTADPTMASAPRLRPSPLQPPHGCVATRPLLEHPQCPTDWTPWIWSPNLFLRTPECVRNKQWATFKLPVVAPPSGTSPSRNSTVSTEPALQAQHRWNRTVLVSNPETITVRNERTPPHARETGCRPGTRCQTPHATPTRKNQKTTNAKQTESQCPGVTRPRGD